MKSLIYLGLVSIGLLSSCKNPEWVGKFKSTNCMTFEYVELYPDKTIDIKYNSAPWAVNRDLTIIDGKFKAEKFVFEYRNDSVFEVSGLEWGCILVRDTLD